MSPTPPMLRRARWAFWEGAPQHLPCAKQHGLHAAVPVPSTPAVQVCAVKRVTSCRMYGATHTVHPGSSNRLVQMSFRVPVERNTSTPFPGRSCHAHYRKSGASYTSGTYLYCYKREDISVATRVLELRCNHAACCRTPCNAGCVLPKTCLSTRSPRTFRIATQTR